MKNLNAVLPTEKQLNINDAFASIITVKTETTQQSEKLIVEFSRPLSDALLILNKQKSPFGYQAEGAFFTVKNFRTLTV